MPAVEEKKIPPASSRAAMICTPLEGTAKLSSSSGVAVHVAASSFTRYTLPPAEDTPAEFTSVEVEASRKPGKRSLEESTDVQRRLGHDANVREQEEASHAMRLPPPSARMLRGVKRVGMER